jgi:hypothetical protein
MFGLPAGVAKSNKCGLGDAPHVRERGYSMVMVGRARECPWGRSGDKRKSLEVSSGCLCRVHDDAQLRVEVARVKIKCTSRAAHRGCRTNRHLRLLAARRHENTKSLKQPTPSPTTRSWSPTSSFEFTVNDPTVKDFL